jgi:hypothetical protein
MSQLDAAMNETFQEMAEQGSGVSPSEVTRSPERPRRRRAESDDAADGSWLEREQSGDAQPRQPRRRRSAVADDDPSKVILEESDDESDDDGDTRRQGATGRDSRGRFLPSRAVTDDDADDDSDEDDRQIAGGRRYDEAEEADDDDDVVEPEGRRRANDDEDRDDSRSERRGRRRFPREVRQEIDRQVRAQVERVTRENEALRAQQQQSQQIEGQALQFLSQAIGTQEVRDRLQSQVMNTRLPLQQRNQAAALLERYQNNEKYVRTYRVALLATIRAEQADRDKQVASELAKYKIRLDPTIVAKGDRSETLVHAVRTGILLERKRNEAEMERLRRSASNRRGSRDEQAVRNGNFGRDSMASSNGRRANGRVATVDRLRGALGNDRGLAAGTQVPMPTDAILTQLRDGRITLRDLGLDR